MTSPLETILKILLVPQFFFQAAVCRVVVVIILLQIGAVCRRQGRRGGKGIDKGVFLFQLRQHGGQTRRHKVGHTAAPAVTAHPELQGAQRLALFRRLNVSSYFFNQLPRRRHKADVGAARPCMKVAGPLGPVAGAAQERPDDGHLPAAAHQRFAGDGAAHGVRGVVQAVGIVEQLHLGKAQLCKGVPDMVGAADLPPPSNSAGRSPMYSRRLPPCPRWPAPAGCRTPWQGWSNRLSL